MIKKLNSNNTVKRKDFLKIFKNYFTFFVQRMQINLKFILNFTNNLITQTKNSCRQYLCRDAASHYLLTDRLIKQEKFCRDLVFYLPSSHIVVDGVKLNFTDIQYVSDVKLQNRNVLHSAASCCDDVCLLVRLQLMAGRTP